MSTEAQITANRSNSQLSTGPASAEGKHKSSHNAVKTGLTGQTILLPTDDVDAYISHIERFTKKFQPANDDERELVQAIIDTEWRLLRIPSLEAGMLADLYPEIADPTIRASYIEGEIQFVYKKDLANLALGETRLLRRRRKLETDALETVQAPRKEAEAARTDIANAVKLYLEADTVRNRFFPQLYGFEFTQVEVEEEVDKLILRNNMIGKADGLSETDYAKSYWRFCGK